MSGIFHGSLSVGRTQDHFIEGMITVMMERNTIVMNTSHGDASSQFFCKEHTDRLTVSVEDLSSSLKTFVIIDAAFNDYADVSHFL